MTVAELIKVLVDHYDLSEDVVIEWQDSDGKCHKRPPSPSAFGGVMEL